LACNPHFIEKGVDLKQQVNPTNILVVEDNPIDVKLLRFLFEQESDWKTEFVVVEDGEEAIDYLMHPDTPKPDLVILDLNLPKRDGTEVIKVIRSADHLYGLRVAVFSSSPEDVMKSKVAGVDVEADAYISKPMDFENFSSIVRRFHQCCYDRAATQQHSGNKQPSEGP
jgi:CheY-like chemotaxis protein